MPRAPDEVPGSHMPLTLTATGSEYFRLWIVNLLLSIVTLGIYSAWARVHTLRYLYRNTRLDGHGFDFHGDPFAILMGRIAVFVPAVLLHLLSNVMPRLSAALLALFFIALPWLIMRSLRFRLANTSHRGLRFGLDGSPSGTCRALLLWPLLALASAGLLAPVAYRRFKQYQHDNSRYGDTRFRLELSTGSLYVVMFASIGMMTVAILLSTVPLAFTTGMEVLGKRLPGPPAILLISLPLTLAAFAIAAFVSASLQNLVWSGTTLGDGALRIRSNVRTLPVFAIRLTNLLGMILTLGLFYPFARIRLLRYRLQQVRVTTLIPPDHLAAGSPQPVSAPGDAATNRQGIGINVISL